MLRAIVLLLGAALALGGLFTALVGQATGAGIEAMVLGGLLVVGTLLEKLRYGESSEIPRGPDWSRSDETFVDPASGRRMTVYENGRTGQRRYVPQERE